MWLFIYTLAGAAFLIPLEPTDSTDKMVNLQQFKEVSFILFALIFIHFHDMIKINKICIFTLQLSFSATFKRLFLIHFCLIAFHHCCKILQNKETLSIYFCSTFLLYFSTVAATE